MTYASRRMPLAAKVNIFNGEVSRDQHFAAGRGLQNRAIIADAPPYRPIAALARQSPDTLNQLFFRGNQSELNYIEKKAPPRVASRPMLEKRVFLPKMAGFDGSEQKDIFVYAL